MISTIDLIMSGWTWLIAGMVLSVLICVQHRVRVSAFGERGMVKHVSGECFKSILEPQRAVFTGNGRLVAPPGGEAQGGGELADSYLDGVFDTLSLSSALIAISVDGEVIRWNREAENYFGIDAGRAISSPVWELVPDLRGYREMVDEAFRCRKPVVRSRRRVVGAGEVRYLDVGIYPVLYGDRKSAVIRLDDVTESVRLDMQLIQVQKMETVGNLAGGLAHDFNNVLTGIVGTVSLVRYLLDKDKKINPESIKKWISTIEKEAGRAGDLAQQLLTLSRQSEPLKAPVDLGDALGDVVKICRNTFDKSIQLIVNHPSEPAMVEADPTQIRQVLLNLCLNASQALTVMRKPEEPLGGTIRISVEDSWGGVRRGSAGGEVPGGRYWTINVVDSGVGIEPNLVKKIFDPFFTTKGEANGTGLGLSMANNIIRHHDGYICVDSVPGQGTTFSVFLPRLENYKAEPRERPARKKLVKGSGLVLVVDDEKSLRDTAGEILRTCGYRVLFAEDGRQCLEVFKENCRDVSLVLLDLMMPNMDGKEAFKQLKAIDPRVKILLTSGYSRDQRVEDIMTMGALGFLAKPFSMHALSQKVHDIIESGSGETPLSRKAA